jgi:hypothetical protein
VTAPKQPDIVVRLSDDNGKPLSFAEDDVDKLRVCVASRVTEAHRPWASTTWKLQVAPDGTIDVWTPLEPSAEEGGAMQASACLLKELQEGTFIKGHTGTLIITAAFR